MDANVTQSSYEVRGHCGIDYRCEDGCFPVYTSCVTISNPDSLPSSETGVDPGLKGLKDIEIEDFIGTSTPLIFTKGMS
jgi:hypothetical protein